MYSTAFSTACRDGLCTLARADVRKCARKKSAKMTKEILGNPENSRAEFFSDHYLRQVARGEFKGFEETPLSMEELFDNDVPWVFFRDNGDPVRHFDRSWKTASRKAELPIAKGERKTFHDFRRTTARELSRAGVPDPIAMSIMEHRTRSMYDRYNIVSNSRRATKLSNHRDVLVAFS